MCRRFGEAAELGVRLSEHLEPLAGNVLEDHVRGGVERHVRQRKNLGRRDDGTPPPRHVQHDAPLERNGQREPEDKVDHADDKHDRRHDRSSDESA